MQNVLPCKTAKVSQRWSQDPIHKLLHKGQREASAKILGHYSGKSLYSQRIANMG
jgi:hypothetical protein